MTRPRLVVVASGDDDALLGKIALLEGLGHGGGSGRLGGCQLAAGGGLRGRRDHPSAFKAKRKMIPLRTSFVGQAAGLAGMAQLGHPVRMTRNLE